MHFTRQASSRQQRRGHDGWEQHAQPAPLSRAGPALAAEVRVEPARWTIDQIAGLVPKPALDTPRHTILLMTGSRHGFTPAMFSSDSVHPNKSGYDFMGDTWYKTIGSLLH